MYDKRVQRIALNYIKGINSFLALPRILPNCAFLSFFLYSGNFIVLGISSSNRVQECCDLVALERAADLLLHWSLVFFMYLFSLSIWVLGGGGGKQV